MEFTNEPEHKLIVENCAARLVVAARRKVIEMTVASESEARRKHIDAMLEEKL